MNVDGRPKNVFAMYKGRLLKVGILVLFSLMMMSVYVAFFQHPPADELLINNRRQLLASGGKYDFGASLFHGTGSAGGNDAEEEEEEDEVADDGDDGEEDEDEDGESKDDAEEQGGEDEEELEEEDKEEDKGEEQEETNKKIVMQRKSSREEKETTSRGKTPEKKKKKTIPEKVTKKVERTKEKKDDVLSHKKRELGSSNEIKLAEYWAEFTRTRNLVPIGAVYSKCEGSRTQLGTVVLMEDKINGGIMARTYVNITLEKTIDGGQLNIDSLYNGRAMYDNYWDICEVEDDLPDDQKTFTCPLKPGHYSKVKDKTIPSYIPKGRYQSKIWATDQDGHMLGCGYSDFTI